MDPFTNAPRPAVVELPRADLEPPTRRRGRRRSSVQRSDLIVLVIVTVMAAVLGALSPGSPTGNSAIDLVYRAAFVGVLALAGSRARRWSVIVASALAAIASVGFGLLFAAAALLMSVFIVGRDVRNRIYGACVGTFIGMACLRLDVDWFLGASALIATVSAALVCWSGYRVSRRSTRRTIRWVMLGAVVLLVLGLGLSVYQALTAISPLESAVDATTLGVNSAQDGRTADAGKQFADATEQFELVADRSAAWWMFPSRLVPVVGQNLEALSVMSEAGARLTSSARRIATEVDYDRIQRDGGGVDLEALEDFVDPVVDASGQLARAAGDVEGLRSPWLAEPLAVRLDEFESKIADLRGQTDFAADALTYGPEMFGRDGERRYLVLLGNPAESRDLGGHIGNWAELSMTDGTLSLVEVGSALDLAQPDLENAVQEADDLPGSFLSMRPATNPQNWGASPDFPTDARVAARLYETKTGRRVDGVVYADPYAMAAMLSITGPQLVPGLTRTISSADAAKFLMIDQFVAFPDSESANDSLTELIGNVFSDLTSSTLPGPRQLGKLFGPLVKAGRLRMVSFQADDHRLLGRVGLDGGFVWAPGEDVLAVVSRNANPSKIDAYLEREVSYDVNWDPATGDVQSKVTVILRNSAPAGGLPRDAIGNSAGLPDGTNITDLAIITPFELEKATLDGLDAGVSPLLENGVWRHSMRAWVPPGGTVTMVFELSGDVDPGREYHLNFTGQPMVNDSTPTVTVTTASGQIVPGPAITVSGPQATTTLSGTGQTILTLRQRGG